MLVRTIALVAGDTRDDIGLDDLRRQVVYACIVGCVVAPLMIMISYSRSWLTPDWVTAAVLALYGVALATVLATRLSVTAGAITVLIGALALLTGCLWIRPLAWYVNLMPLGVLFASTFFDVAGGLVAAAAVTLDLIALDATASPMTPDAVRLILVLTWANVVVAWLASQPIRLALRWSWTEYRRAEREADRARRQQAELARVVKSLNLAQDRLEHLNHEMERARRAADEARRLKMEFAATISHELRTPLNLIIGFSEMMAADASQYVESHSTATYQRDADTIYRNARHLSSLIDDILDLSQIDAARMGLVREPVALADLIAEAVASVEPLFHRKSLRLSVNVPTTLPPASLDRARIRQILINLLSNAARFTDEGGVTISAWIEDNHAVASVADTGTGITADDLPIIFEEFRQGSSAGARRAGGNGLGLAISKRLVELHGGTMWVDSHPGEGSTFFFSLPLCTNVASVPLRREWDTRAPTGDDSRHHDTTIVVLDDDVEPVHLLERYLDGHQVIGARSLADIRRARERYSLSAIVITGPTDAEMRRRVQQVRTRFSDLPVLLCPLPGRRRLAEQLGVVEYLVKPVFQEQVARLVRRGGHLAHEVMVVDDDPDLVDLLARMIQTSSRRTHVRTCYGGDEAIAALQTERPDLILLDLLMPHTDGYTVLEAVRSDPKLQEIPIVVLTARGEEAETINAGMLSLTRGDGLSVADLVRVLRVSVETLGESLSSESPPSIDPMTRAAPLESPALERSR